jgi:hypothetical protein
MHPLYTDRVSSEQSQTIQQRFKHVSRESLNNVSVAPCAWANGSNTFQKRFNNASSHEGSACMPRNVFETLLQRCPTPKAPLERFFNVHGKSVFYAFLNGFMCLSLETRFV